MKKCKHELVQAVMLVNFSNPYFVKCLECGEEIIIESNGEK